MKQKFLWVFALILLLSNNIYADQKETPDIQVSLSQLVEGVPVSEETISPKAMVNSQEIGGEWIFSGAHGFPLPKGIHSINVKFIPDNLAAYNTVNKDYTINIGNVDDSTRKDIVLSADRTSFTKGESFDFEKMGLSIKSDDHNFQTDEGFFNIVISKPELFNSQSKIEELKLGDDFTLEMIFTPKSGKNYRTVKKTFNITVEDKPKIDMPNHHKAVVSYMQFADTAEMEDKIIEFWLNLPDAETYKNYPRLQNFSYEYLGYDDPNEVIENVEILPVSHDNNEVKFKAKIKFKKMLEHTKFANLKFKIESDNYNEYELIWRLENRCKSVKAEDITFDYNIYFKQNYLPQTKSFLNTLDKATVESTIQEKMKVTNDAGEEIIGNYSDWIFPENFVEGENEFGFTFTPNNSDLYKTTQFTKKVNIVVEKINVSRVYSKKSGELTMDNEITLETLELSSEIFGEVTPCKYELISGLENIVAGINHFEVKVTPNDTKFLKEMNVNVNVNIKEGKKDWIEGNLIEIEKTFNPFDANPYFDIDFSKHQKDHYPPKFENPKIELVSQSNNIHIGDKYALKMRDDYSSNYYSDSEHFYYRYIYNRLNINNVLANLNTDDNILNKEGILTFKYTSDNYKDITIVLKIKPKIYSIVDFKGKENLYTPTFSIPYKANNNYILNSILKPRLHLDIQTNYFQAFGNISNNSLKRIFNIDEIQNINLSPEKDPWSEEKALTYSFKKELDTSEVDSGSISNWLVIKNKFEYLDNKIDENFKYSIIRGTPEISIGRTEFENPEDITLESLQPKLTYLGEEATDIEGKWVYHIFNDYREKYNRISIYFYPDDNGYNTAQARFEVEIENKNYFGLNAHHTVRGYVDRGNKLVTIKGEGELDSSNWKYFKDYLRSKGLSFSDPEITIKFEDQYKISFGKSADSVFKYFKGSLEFTKGQLDFSEIQYATEMFAYFKPMTKELFDKLNFKNLKTSRDMFENVEFAKDISIDFANKFNKSGKWFNANYMFRGAKVGTVKNIKINTDNGFGYMYDIFYNVNFYKNSEVSYKDSYFSVLKKSSRNVSRLYIKNNPDDIEFNKTTNSSTPKRKTEIYYDKSAVFLWKEKSSDTKINSRYYSNSVSYYRPSEYEEILLLIPYDNKIVNKDVLLFDKVQSGTKLSDLDISEEYTELTWKNPERIVEGEPGEFIPVEVLTNGEDNGFEDTRLIKISKKKFVKGDLNINVLLKKNIRNKYSGNVIKEESFWNADFSDFKITKTISNGNIKEIDFYSNRRIDFHNVYVSELPSDTKYIGKHQYKITSKNYADTLINFNFYNQTEKDKFHEVIIKYDTLYKENKTLEEYDVKAYDKKTGAIVEGDTLLLGYYLSSHAGFDSKYIKKILFVPKEENYLAKTQSLYNVPNTEIKPLNKEWDVMGLYNESEDELKIIPNALELNEKTNNRVVDKELYKNIEDYIYNKEKKKLKVNFISPAEENAHHYYGSTLLPKDSSHFFDVGDKDLDVYVFVNFEYNSNSNLTEQVENGDYLFANTENFVPLHFKSLKTGRYMYYNMGNKKGVPVVSEENYDYIQKTNKKRSVHINSMFNSSNLEDISHAFDSNNFIDDIYTSYNTTPRDVSVKTDGLVKDSLSIEKLTLDKVKYFDYKNILDGVYAKKIFIYNKHDYNMRTKGVYLGKKTNNKMINGTNSIFYTGTNEIKEIPLDISSGITLTRVSSVELKDLFSTEELGYLSKDSLNANVVDISSYNSLSDDWDLEFIKDSYPVEELVNKNLSGHIVKEWKDREYIISGHKKVFPYATKNKSFNDYIKLKIADEAFQFNPVIKGVYLRYPQLEITDSIEIDNSDIVESNIVTDFYYSVYRIYNSGFNIDYFKTDFLVSLNNLKIKQGDYIKDKFISNGLPRLQFNRIERSSINDKYESVSISKKMELEYFKPSGIPNYNNISMGESVDVEYTVTSEEYKPFKIIVHYNKTKPIYFHGEPSHAYGEGTIQIKQGSKTIENNILNAAGFSNSQGEKVAGKYFIKRDGEQSHNPSVYKEISEFTIGSHLVYLDFVPDDSQYKKVYNLRVYLDVINPIDQESLEAFEYIEPEAKLSELKFTKEYTDFTLEWKYLNDRVHSSPNKIEKYEAWAIPKEGVLFKKAPVKIKVKTKEGYYLDEKDKHLFDNLNEKGTKLEEFVFPYNEKYKVEWVNPSIMLNYDYNHAAYVAYEEIRITPLKELDKYTTVIRKYPIKLSKLKEKIRVDNIKVSPNKEISKSIYLGDKYRNKNILRLTEHDDYYISSDFVFTKNLLTPDLGIDLKWQNVPDKSHATLVFKVSSDNCEDFLWYINILSAEKADRVFEKPDPVDFDETDPVEEGDTLSDLPTPEGGKTVIIDENGDELPADTLIKFGHVYKYKFIPFNDMYKIVFGKFSIRTNGELKNNAVSTDLIIHKLQYKTGTDIDKIQNTGEELDIIKFENISKYNTKKYGEVYFTIYQLNMSKISQEGLQLTQEKQNEIIDDIKQNKEKSEYVEEDGVMTDKTDDDGIIKFPIENNLGNEEQRKYYAIFETKKPLSVVQTSNPFIIAAPLHTDTHVYPKNELQPLSLEVLVNKYDVNTDDELTKFAIDTKAQYNLYKDNVQINTEIIETDDNGKITLDNLSIGEYKLVPVDNDKYKMNNILKFSVEDNGITGQRVIYSNTTDKDAIIKKDSIGNIFRTTIKTHTVPTATSVIRDKTINNSLNFDHNDIELALKAPMSIDTIKQHTFKTKLTIDGLKEDLFEIEATPFIVPFGTTNNWKATEENLIDYLNSHEISYAKYDEYYNNSTVELTREENNYYITTELPLVDNFKDKFPDFEADIKTENASIKDVSDFKYEIVFAIKFKKPNFQEKNNTFTIDDIFTIKNFGVIATKVNGLYGVPGTETLEGAEFLLRDDTNNKILKCINVDTNEFAWIDYDYDVNGGDVYVGEGYTFISDSKGQFLVKYLDKEKLKNGEYSLLEIKAPEGYYLPNDRIIKLEYDGENYAEINIINEKELSMPATGKNTLYNLLIIAISLLGVSGLILRKKRYTN